MSRKLPIILGLSLIFLTSSLSMESHQPYQSTDKQIFRPVTNLPVILEPAKIPSFQPRKIIDQVDPVPKVEIYSKVYKGVASWYCLKGVSRCTRGYGSGYYAAIRRDLLSLRGSTVRVCSSSKCIKVKIIDCNCGPNANLIDLYSDAFRALAPLSAGKVSVTVSK